MRQLWIRGAIAAVLGCLAPIALAQSGASGGCEVSLPDLDLGRTSSMSGLSDLDGEARVLVRCSATSPQTVSFTVSLSAGDAGSYNPRLVTSEGGDTLPYNVYIDANRTTVFGDGTMGTQTVSETMNLPAQSVVSISLFSRWTIGTNPPPGLYRDSLLFTLEY